MVPTVDSFMLAASMMTTANHRLLIVVLCLEALSCKFIIHLYINTPNNVFSQSFHWMKLSESDDKSDDDSSVCNPL